MIISFCWNYVYFFDHSHSFVLRLNVPVNNFSVMSGWSHRFLGINQYFRGVKGLAQGHNTAAVGFEPPTSRSGVRHSTTELPRSPILILRPALRKCFLENLQAGSLQGVS